MRFKTRLTEEDYLEFNRYHVMNSPEGIKAFRGYRHIIPISCLIILAALLILDIGYIGITAGFLAVTVIVWLIMCRKWFVKGIDLKVKNTFKGGRMPFNEEEDLIFADEYIVSTGSNGTMSLRYENIRKALEHKEYIYIYADDVSAIIIPWEYLGERRDAVRKILKEKAGM